MAGKWFVATAVIFGRQGINSTEVENKLHDLMLGQGDWKKTARELKARYLFWGNLEKTNYGNSSRPWEKQLPLVAQGSLGEHL